MVAMKCDSTCTYVIACSIYGTNTLHGISTVANNIKWTCTKQKVYSKVEKNIVDVIFHRLNFIHMYNFGMVSVDVTDQLCLQYIPDHWMRNRKWWWFISL